jgi:hypothetical protein
MDTHFNQLITILAAFPIDKLRKNPRDELLKPLPLPSMLRYPQSAPFGEVVIQLFGIPSCHAGAQVRGPQ